ncbi:MAG TPA: hypothetical protein VIL69_19945 [Roseomonas sp.]|jgi:hypothetical protein
MSSFNLTKALRTLGLAAALMSPILAGSAFAEGTYIAGPTASQAWSQTDARTPLAGNDAAQNFLLRSGATGNGGQHS